ncbi:MAG TPA: hypothetical protein PLO65_00670 [Caulobacter sp.]|nr:hypothetical protein [Caulobacter sp.]
MARAGKPTDTRIRPWLLLAPLPLTVGAAAAFAWLRIDPPLLVALWLVLGSVSAGIVARAWDAITEETPLPTFTVLSRVDAYADYVAQVEADSPEEAVDLAYDGDPSVKWEPLGVVEFDARRVVALSADGEEIESTARGKG